MSYMKQVCEILGIKQGQEFKVVPTESAKLLGHTDNDNIYMIAGELLRKGYDDGWSEWYGGNSRMLELILIGYYEIITTWEIKEIDQ